jgi:predicted nucleic acid-binding protein
MRDRVFVDTNIWLYALIQSAPNDERHRTAAQALLALHRPVINTQVIHELSSNLLKKKIVSELELQMYIQEWYADCCLVASNFSQELQASQLRQAYKFSYWDSLLVAAAFRFRLPFVL